MLISDDYRQLNRDLHAGGLYGHRGDKWLEAGQFLVQRFNPETILDYGCGQGALGRGLGRPIAEYDPAIAGKEALPEPADLVICTDVIEHIEPELIDGVLDHLQSLTQTCLFAVISTRPANKFLADGRNAHLIVEPWDWWREKVVRRFHIAKQVVEPTQVKLVLTPLREAATA
jgi:2-polyprenyl-3-methyl-5-hydroxy-6-metoxy-1,4-benzoquinol methylase